MKNYRRSMASKALDTFRRYWTLRSQPRTTSRTAPFWFEMLEQRLALTHSPTDHVHAELQIFLEGQEVVIPPNIGLTSTGHFNPHTHDFNGILHMGEGGPAGTGTETRLITLDDFFDVWRTTNVGQPTNNPNAAFDATHIMNRTASATHAVRMYVNGQLNTQFESYTPHDGDEIVISYEPVSTPVGSPMLEPISNQTVLVGSPLMVALDGFDPQGQNLTYTVTSSNSSVVQASVLSGNRSMRIDVPNFGKMTFQLFDNFAPRVTNAIASLANSGFYNGLTFHRIIDNFVIQAGSHNGTGGANPNVPDFDDQFHFDLQHNSTGLLSMAKSQDDTNDTQFFVTDAATRHLDFNHSIFGKLTDGEEVRNAINSVAVDGNDKPLSAVSMSSVQIFTDNENGVLMLKAAPGATSGSSTITVTATDSQGNTFVRTFVATLAADASNGSPFLGDIATVVGTAGQNVQFQLPGNDVEGDAIAYSATKVGSVNYTVNVSSGGLVTVTPPTGFTGSFQVQVSAKAASQQSIPDAGQQITDVQLVTVQVGSAAPTSVDLVVASDTGLSSSDNITNASPLSFAINGVATGAAVKLFAGNTVIAQGTATGSTLTLSVSSATLGAGTHQISATQTVLGQESSHTANLPVTVDLTAPAAFTSTPPAAAAAGSLLSYNAQHPEEGTAGFRYALVGAPSGVAIDPVTGQVTWTPSQSQVGVNSFSISATDAAGNATPQVVSITVGEPVVQLAQVALSIVNASGQPITSLQLNQDFFLVARVQDLRSNPLGVFSIFTDVTFNSNLATVTGPIQFSSQYSSVTTGSTATPGLLDEVGGLSVSIAPIGGGFKELFRVPMRATGAGAIHFISDPPDAEGSEILLYDHDPVIEPQQTTFGSLSVGIALSFTPNNDTITVNEDSANTTINVLANDTIQAGSGNVLTITSVGARSNGGTVAVAADGKSLRYTPAANFVGTETFTYTVQNQSGASASATVTATVNNVNDPPTAGNDTFTVLQNSSNNTLSVLTNDSAAPDSGETLTVTAVSAGSQQGTITVAPGGTGVRYSPKANFTGTETFSYTISDGHGGTRQANVTVTVNSPGPVANNDTITVQEDSSATTINVLANDVPAAAGGQTLTVASVGTANHGGTVTRGSNGANVIYTPAANFQGTETFTYTLSDGQGGTATTSVTVTVTNINDAPTATNDTLDAFKNTTTTLDVLGNDVSAPDPAEALTITAITQGAHGTVAISQNGTRITFSPTADYTGPDSFTYTMRDPGGLTSTATVNLTVRDFIPSSLAGSIFLDHNLNGVADPGENRLAGVEVKLTGTAQGGNPVSFAVHSAADGTYNFQNLPPGNYTVQQTQPQFLTNGQAAVGNLAGATAVNGNTIQVNLQQGTNAQSLSFSEVGKPRQLTRMEEFFARNLRSNLLASIPYTAPATSNASFPTAVAPAWRTPVGTQWSALTEFKFAVSNNNQQLRVEAKNATNQTVQATVPLADTSRVLDLGTQNGQRLFRLLGNPTAFNFQPVPQAQAEGEDDQTIDAALAAISSNPADDLAAALAANQSADERAIDEAMTESQDWLI